MKMIIGTLAILFLGAAGIAAAGEHKVDRDRGHGHDRDSGGASSHGTTSLTAPEINPASALAALTLLGGGLVVLRGRRGSKPQA